MWWRRWKDYHVTCSGQFLKCARCARCAIRPPEERVVSSLKQEEEVRGSFVEGALEMSIQRPRVFGKKEVERYKGVGGGLMASSSPIVSQSLPVVQVLLPVS